MLDALLNETDLLRWEILRPGFQQSQVLVPGLQIQRGLHGLAESLDKTLAELVSILETNVLHN